MYLLNQIIYLLLTQTETFVSDVEIDSDGEPVSDVEIDSDAETISYLPNLNLRNQIYRKRAKKKALEILAKKRAKNIQNIKNKKKTRFTTN